MPPLLLLMLLPLLLLLLLLPGSNKSIARVQASAPAFQLHSITVSATMHNGTLTLLPLARARQHLPIFKANARGSSDFDPSDFEPPLAPSPRLKDVRLVEERAAAAAASLSRAAAATGVNVIKGGRLLI